ncbi:cytochrome P450 [Lentinula aff. lateritia]|uniref:Cytochrome P450 n=1 Tax=Lentinula aff. lateritia TaxID=2804960 RepID=A0ACC1TUE6_9AGAR|nr:cytochrome P450 [Lentinula aff. lateritia]
MIPPGPALIFRLVLPQILFMFCVYAIKTAIEIQGHAFSTSTRWLLYVGAFLARPLWMLFLARPCINILNTRRAAAKGAVLPPLVEESSSEVLASVMRSFGNGYIGKPPPSSITYPSISTIDPIRFEGEAYLEWAQKYGNTYRYQAYTETRVMTLEPEHIKAILATQFNNFEKGLVNYQQLKSLLGSGVFNSDGDINMTRPFFSKTRISDFDIFERHADDAISAMKQRLAQGYPIEFQDAIGRFTLDSATEFLFGKDVGSLGAGLPYPKGAPTIEEDSSSFTHPSNIFVRAFTQGQDQAALRGRRGDMWPMAEFWSDNVKAQRAQVDNFTNPILQERRNEQLARGTTSRSKESDEDGESETFLDHLIRSTDDDQIIRDELVNILVAGRDTTASLLTFAIYVLTERPELTERLRKEILEFVGSNARPTYKNIADMKYLRAFLNETLRLYPAVPFNSRYSKTSIVLPAKNGQPPLYIPAGVNVFLMHRRADLWGPDSLEFDPDRFIDDRAQRYLIPNPFIFAAFNAGPRICIGQQFAYNEASYFLIRFLQSFTGFQVDWAAQPESSRPPAEWEPLPGTTKGREKVKLSSHLTMVVKLIIEDGLWVKMQEREIKL